MVEAEICWDGDEETKQDGFCVELEIDFTISGEYVPEKVSGPPEDCYPAEYPEVEVEAISWDGRDVPIEWVFGDRDWSPPWALKEEDFHEQVCEDASDDCRY